MIILKRAEDLSKLIKEEKAKGKKIGFVPTMGALHNGHLALVKTCSQQNDLSVCSIFINPEQFNNAEDLAHYPVTLEKDIEMLLEMNADVLFLPPFSQVYPENYKAKYYELSYLETILEGRYRPGHFQGVCKVMDQFLEMIHPDQLFLGQKDYQQCKVIKRMMDLTGKSDETMVHIIPTEREKDGLAMSSRNLRLNIEQRKTATELFRKLEAIKKALNDHPLSSILESAKSELIQLGFQVDYLEVVQKDTLLPAKSTKESIALVAASIGGIRLIDNMILN